MKVVVNRCFGGFGLSAEAMEELGLPLSDYAPMHNHVYNEDFGIVSEDSYAYRTEPRLVGVVEKLGEKASGSMARLVVVAVPDDVAWEIEEYDGQEWVSEKHRTW